MTYYESIIRNLRRYERVAAIHPRLAYLGVGSELEIMFKEITPVVLGTLVEDITKRDDFRSQEALGTTVARQALRSLGDKLFLSVDVRAFLREMFGSRNQGGRDGAARHTRLEISFTDVNMAVNKAVAFVEQLRSVCYECILSCRKCETSDQTFFLSVVLDAEVDSSVNVPCTRCREPLVTYTVPNTAEMRHLYFGDDGSSRQLALERICEVVNWLLVGKLVKDEITSEMLSIKQALLKLIVEQ